MDWLSSSSSPSISRRTLLKLFGIGTIGGLVGYSRLMKPQPTVFKQDTLALPYQLDQPKQVVVIGGGLAGLACAYELSQRGFVVTLLERAAQLGGKIASWDIQVGDQPFRMEHGFHGFFPQYYNLKSIVSELEIENHFKSLNYYSVVYRDKKYDPEVFRPSHSAFPWNIVDLAIASTNRLQWGLNLTKYAHWQVFREITGFHPQKSYGRLDHLSVAQWVENEFPRGLYDLYFLPFAKSSLNAPDVMSAAELMQFFHFYFFGNPEGLAFNGTVQDMGRSLVDPIVNAITATGGQVITEATVNRVGWDQGRISSVEYQIGGNSRTVPFWVKRNPLLSTDELEFFGAGDAVYAIAPNQQEAMSLSCTHQGCTVHTETDGHFHCPCHGAEYDDRGRVLRGPAQRDLPRFKVLSRDGEQIQLVAMQADTTPTQTVQADYYVFAADIPGVQHLFSLSEGEPHAQVAKQVQELTVADPFAVARFWFDRDFDWEHSDFTSLSGYRLTDSITLYHRIQDDYIDWAKRTGGSVVELHAYCYKEREFPTQQALLTTFESELYEIVPALQSATMLHRELVNQKNFAGFPPNSYSDRPETATLVSNLMFAGDWVKMPFPCGLMERAVSSGLLAANEILHREGVQRRSLLTVSPQGLLQI
ncbi:FAD-dependent oxidoreductase [Oscillatoria sp. FACHB-1407]|uniref:FAD-dependent oxidoreductase n=1 Tax=Oscillatoria sp. FACHB-1407 TaxID=2692847 RepID=UPI001687C685|nr:FAD-dependent oxidoreductase [Oscillatoria sp. FACHB-1407]MBD2461953.1 FAD-dependent oxidoreductase [Oscillatoria sp. FACHB-1407]